ncbi:beta transducin [Microbotryomycetes sp. JL201]|nr:beta transducin [Microbotryomycetes sp. JL201]
MVRSYLRHGPTESFGLVASASSNSVFDGRKAYVPALEDVLVWDVKKGEQHAMWHETGLRSLVTCISRSPTDWNAFAVGYQDGSIRVWSAQTQTVTVTFNGHKNAVSALAWDADGTKLASGSNDTDIIIWDVIGEEGLFRLRGHRNQITQLRFLSARPVETDDATRTDGQASSSASTVAQPDAATSANAPSTHLLSASKDTFLKLFDLATQHCIETVVGHRSETWSFAYDSDSSVIISGGGEGEVKCWKINQDILRKGVVADESGKLKRAVIPVPALSLPTTSHTHNIGQITFHPTMPILAIHSSERTIDVFRVRTEEELKKKLARRRKREREKNEKKGKGKQDEGSDEEQEPTSNGAGPEWRDRLAVWSIIRPAGKIRSFSFAPETAKARGDVQIMTALANNAIEVFKLPPPPSSKAPAIDPIKLLTLDLPGHRTDIRTLSVSSDDELIASASQGSLKIWNRKTTKCIRTLECGYAICSTFLPGDRHIVVGCKSGEIMLYDLSSASLLETFAAHSGPVWSMHVRPDGRGLVSGSGDKDVKFWDFEVREIQSEVEGGPIARVLTMAHVKTLKMTDDVLAVKYSPDGRLLAVSLLDSTVKVFFADTLKFSLSLYGHKLPVLSLDISDDNKLIITCSADKNIKIWGLDFGDCHRSLFAHDESVMQVAFERGTHYFWSVGKDKMVKYWDGDKFECIQKLAGHAGEVWAMAVSRRGNFVVTGSHDKSIRIWEKTEEPLFLEEEREREMEELFDTDPSGRDRDGLKVVSGKAEDELADDAADVQKSTTETLMAGERIMEALEISTQDRQQTLAYRQEVAGLDDKQASKVPAPTRNPIFQMYNNCGPEEYVLRVVRSIPAANLQDALLVLPFSKVAQLIEHLDVWASKSWEITTTSRVLFFLLRTHHSQIVATRSLRPIMISLRRHLRDALDRQKNTLGYNLAALRYVQRQHEAATTAEFYEKDVMADETKVRQKIEQSMKKRKRATLRS